MKKYDLTRILVEGNHLILKKFVAEIEQNYEVVITKLPEKGLVMMKTNDSVSNQPFYLGELLVTECTVSVNESIGFGIIIGERISSPSSMLRFAENCRKQKLGFRSSKRKRKRLTNV